MAEILDEEIFDINDARSWYESIYSSELYLKSQDFSTVPLKAMPNWNQAIRSFHPGSKTIEIPLTIQGEFGFATEESYSASTTSGDNRFMVSGTSVIIEKTAKTTIGFLMTVIPDKDYQLSTDFHALASTYKKWQKGFNGIILYHDLNGKFSNGWKLIDGKVVSSVKHFDKNEPDIHITKSCFAYFLVTWSNTCFNNTTKSTNNCIYTEEWNYLYTLCDDVGVGSGGGDIGSYIPPVQQPCDGDPILDVSIAPTSLNGDPITGMFGCVRYSSDTICDTNRKYHYGIDIACDPGTQVFSMKGGLVIDMVSSIEPNSAGDGTSRGDLGNFVTVRYTNSNGNNTDITYAHLNYVYATMGSNISYGQIIGLSGKTGNATLVPNAHVHIKIVQNGTIVDPAGYFASFISPDGNVLNPCNSSINPN